MKGRTSVVSEMYVERAAAAADLLDVFTFFFLWCIVGGNTPNAFVCFPCQVKKRILWSWAAGTPKQQQYFFFIEWAK